LDDQSAIERYRYMLRTAPPDDIERAHAEAFAQLSPEQRRIVLQELSGQIPPFELPQSDDPQALARTATRAEMRNPGTMERTFSMVPAGPGLGGMFLSTLAGAFVGTAVADAFFGGDGGGGADASDAAGADQADSGYGAEDAGADADFGGDFGAGGDFGGGDFGGGDFGGGDIGI
jgi:hypothetical protein